VAKNVRNYKTFKTGRGIKVSLHLSPKVVRELDLLAKEGYYRSRNDAIRDSINFFLSVKPWLRRLKYVHEILESTTPTGAEK